MAVVIELLDASNRPLEVRRFDAQALTVGRAFDCDFILADPHVDPCHCRIEVVPGEGFLVHDVGTVNGTRAGRRVLRGDARAVAAGTVLTLGRSRLRLFDPAAAVAPAIPLNHMDALADRAGRAWLCVALLALVALAMAVESYQFSDATFLVSDVFSEWLLGFAVIGGVAGFWALIGRIGRRKANVSAHLSVAALSFLLVWAWELTLDPVLYNLNRMGEQWFLAAIGSGLIFVLGQFIHLAMATHLHLWQRLAITAMIFLVTPGLLLYREVEAVGEFSARVHYYTNVYPPPWHIGEAVDAPRLLQRIGKLFDAADAGAPETVP